MRQQDDKPLSPGSALNQLIFWCLWTWVFYAWGSAPGWEMAMLGAILGAAGVLKSAAELVRAHRDWKIRHALEEEATRASNRFTTKRPHSLKPPDGWK